MNYAFTELFDIPKLTQLCESYTQTNGVVTALLDLNGNIHIKTGWQDICSRFHRVNPTSAQRCTESDTELANQLGAGKKYNVYQCSNGLVDVAVPVYVDGEHVGNFFTGQFLFKKADKSYFEKQAEQLGFEPIEYLDALNKVPIFSEPEIRRIMAFLVNLAQVIGEMGKARLENLRLQALEREQMQELVVRTKELEEVKNQLEKLALEDPLTCLHNRRKFDKRIVEEFSRAKRYERPLTLALIDIDLFKEINDTHGHAAGDDTLVFVADTLRKHLRNCDFIARIGGDEFCVIFPETLPNQVIPLLNELNRAINARKSLTESGPFSVSCSFGVASVDDSCQSTSMLMKRADESLYKAKSKGRNRIEAY